MKTAQQFVDSVRALEREVYILGERVDDVTAHPILRPSLNALAKTYELAHDPTHRHLLVRQGLGGHPVNCFTTLHGSTADLLNKVRAQRLLGQQTATCFQRCVGWDALNAVEGTTYDMDAALGADYHRRFMAYLGYVQQDDLVCDGAMTDVKGDRGRRPSEQADPDLYLHVVDRTSDGIVVRGAKAHQTGALFSHEILVMPTLTLREGEKDYAVSFAIPSDSKGLVYVLGRQPSDTRKLENSAMDVGNPTYGSHEALVIFNDVFVPRERLFMDGEWQFAGTMVERFAAYHRQSYGGCKVGVGDVLIGAAALATKFAGVQDKSHVRRKLGEMVRLNETLFCCGLACSEAGAAMPSGTYLANVLLANVCKQNVTCMPYEIARLAEDLAGGLVVTLPSEKDLNHPKVGPLIEKYLRGVADVPTADRMRLLRLIESMTLGAGSAAYRTESMHGAGSPEAQMIMIGRLSDLEAKMALARRVAGIA